MNQANLLQDVKAINSIPAIANILEVVCRTTKMGFAAVARVTEEKWMACAVNDLIEFGLKPGGELKLETTICHEIHQHHKAVVIDHVAKDEAYADHHTPLMYGFQSYISMPIILKNGEFFGTLCAIDPNPAKLNTIEIVGMFNLFAELIAFHLDALKQIEISEINLKEERKTAELREQFIAILGHDLRNPVAAALNAAQVLLRMPLDERAKRLAHLVQESSYRMKSLIENILDFARGRLGEGIILDYNSNEPLAPILSQVVDELKMVWPEREIKVEFDFIRPVNCDGTRVAQLFSNILGNALSHGLKNSPVAVLASSNNSQFMLTVTNLGEKIPEQAMEKLFHPFSRGEVKAGQQGLGLGLYIASEIAKAHQGTLTVHSTDEKTVFTFIIPNS
ncbi:histidine kinase [Pedobacter sp. Hv1]|nr:histidine kinase [Pedobacter sp. Hv1]